MTQEWAVDYERALARGREAGRPVMVFFWMEGRPLCREMEAETLAAPAVTKLLSERFVGVKVDVQKRPDLYADLLGGRGALATAVVDDRGDVISSMAGYAEAPAFQAFLSKALDGIPRLREAREASERAPSDFGALFALGEVYASLDSPKRAEESFRKVIGGAGAEARWVAFSHERLARFRAMRGRCREAREHLAEYRRRDPEGTLGRADRALVTEAVVCAFERRHEESLRLFGEALRRFPGSDEVDYMLLMSGVVHHEGGGDAKALELLEEMLRRFPKSPWSTYARLKVDHIKNPPPDHQH